MGALTVVLTRSSGTTEETGDTERSSLYASEILKYASGLAASINRLQQSGCSENQISFWTDTNSDNTENSSDKFYSSVAPTNHSCHVFDAAGAGMKYSVPNPAWLDQTKSTSPGYDTLIFNAWNAAYGVGKNCGSSGETDCSELLLIVPYVSLDVCKAINRSLGILPTVDSPSNPPQNNGDLDARVFVGHFEYAQDIYNVGESLKGKKSACIQGGSNVWGIGASGEALTPASGTYFFYSVLIVR